MTTATDDAKDRLGASPLRCPDNAATHYVGCPCHEAAWAEKLAAAESRLSRATEALREIEAAEEIDFLCERWNRGEIEAERAAREKAEARVAELEAHRTRLDCRFVGHLAEWDGSHCPTDEPCQRCELERAVEALRGAEAHHDEQARLWADNESDGEADLNAQYHSERRDVFTAVLAEVGK